MLMKFFSSRAGKRFFNFAYCWGACVIILGAVFKITSLPYDNLLLLIGMTTEVVVFFLSGFDEPARDYKWERVFPELNDKTLDDTTKARAVRNRALGQAPVSDAYTEQTKALENNVKVMTEETKRMNEYVSLLNKQYKKMLESMNVNTDK